MGEDAHGEGEGGYHITISYLQDLLVSPTLIYLISRIHPCIAAQEIRRPCYISGEQPSECPAASLDPATTVLHLYNHGLSYYCDVRDASTGESQQSRVATPTSP